MHRTLEYLATAASHPVVAGAGAAVDVTGAVALTGGASDARSVGMQTTSPGWISVSADASFAARTAVSDRPEDWEIRDQESLATTVQLSGHDGNELPGRGVDVAALIDVRPAEAEAEVVGVCAEPDAVERTGGLFEAFAAGTHRFIPGVITSSRVRPFAAASGRM